MYEILSQGTCCLTACNQPVQTFKLFGYVQYELCGEHSGEYQYPVAIVGGKHREWLSEQTITDGAPPQLVAELKKGAVNLTDSSKIARR